MSDQQQTCPHCGHSLRGQGIRVVRVRDVLYHGWCWLVFCAPSAPGKVRLGGS